VLAFTFPGQGSQRPGMGRSWIDHPSWELVREGSELTGIDLTYLLIEADADELKHTSNAQIATFTSSLVILDAVERLGLSPTYCAGHSLGEYTALVAAGALSFEEGVRLVAERGEAMRIASETTPGTMVALVGLSDDDAEAACQRAEGDVWVANYNSPGQVILAGTEEALERAIAIAKELGAKKAMRIPVGGAFHTPLMQSARPRLRKALSEITFRPPEVPVIANVDARPHQDPESWPGLLSAQLCSPVRWSQTVQVMYESGIKVFAELGPGGVLTGLARRIVPGGKGVSVATPDDLEKLIAATTEGSSSVPFHLAGHGEHLYITERLVISPAAGLFEPAQLDVPHPLERARDPNSADSFQRGPQVNVGDVIGWASGVEICSPFAGELIGILAIPGERLTEGQPVAWLRVE